MVHDGRWSMASADPDRSEGEQLPGMVNIMAAGWGWGGCLEETPPDGQFVEVSSIERGPDGLFTWYCYHWKFYCQEAP